MIWWVTRYRVVRRYIKIDLEPVCRIVQDVRAKLTGVKSMMDGLTVAPTVLNFTGDNMQRQGKGKWAAIM